MSESLEMYLATIVRLREFREKPLPLSALADALSISSVSAYLQSLGKDVRCAIMFEGGEEEEATGLMVAVQEDFERCRSITVYRFASP
jgi:hypothetical protein